MNTVLRYIVISVNICHTTIPNLLTLKSLLLEKETQFFFKTEKAAIYVSGFGII